MRVSPFGAWVPFGRRGFWPGAEGRTSPASPAEPLRSPGQLLRESREAKGLRLRDLASRTRISIAVLEALERGWKDRLPEATYLRTMLPLLEHQLDLPAGSLESVLPDGGQEDRGLPPRRGLAATVFAPFTSHVLTTWRGALLYALLSLALLNALNLQQRRLAAMGRLVVEPIPLAPLEASPSGERAAAGSLGTNELAPADRLDPSPLARAAAGQAMELLARELQTGETDFSLGLLELDLETPTQLDLRSRGGGHVHLERLQGTLTLPVVPPFQLRLSPAPGPTAVRWRGKPLARAHLPTPELTGGEGKGRVYAVPPRGAASPARAPSPP